MLSAAVRVFVLQTFTAPPSSRKRHARGAIASIAVVATLRDASKQGDQDRIRTLNAAAIRTVSVSQEARRQSGLYPWPMTGLPRTRFNWQQYEGRNGLLPKQAIQSGRLMGRIEKALKAA
jgi:hypothetical protein